MIGKLRFQDQTAEMIMSEVTSRNLSLPDQLRIVDTIIEKANQESSRVSQEIEEEFSIMAKDNGTSAKLEIEKAQVYRRALLLLESVQPFLPCLGTEAHPDLLLQLLEELRAAKMNNMPPQDINTIITRVISDLERLVKYDYLPKKFTAAVTALKTEMSAGLPKVIGIRMASLSLNGGNADIHRDKIGALFTTWEHTQDFIKELRLRSENLQKKVALFDDCNSSEELMKINWLGSRTDCKILIKFLNDNGYINVKFINKFIARHFSFKGISASADSIGGLKTGSDGKFLDFEDRLEIPARE